MCVVGFDFGTTVGSVCARFLSESSARLEQSQYNQPINDGERCSTLNYTVYTNHTNELLHISASLLQVNVFTDKVYKDTISHCTGIYNANQFGCLGEYLKF